MKIYKKIHVGLRTAKTVVAVILSMIIVDFYGTSASKLIFAMLGAMAAVQPTFKASVESCLTQIVGVIFGAAVGVVLSLLPLSHLAATAIGIILIITLYNLFHISFSPSLPCMILVMIAISEVTKPLVYAYERIWDTAIGLGIGMLVNMLVFPYDNSKKILATAESLNRELIVFMEDMFDGDDALPDSEHITKQIDFLAEQLKLFSNQKLILRLKRQKEELELFRQCEGKARMLVAQMEVLCRMGYPGALDAENRQRLEECGAVIQDCRTFDSSSEVDIVTNYHVRQLLSIRQELLQILNK